MKRSTLLATVTALLFSFPAQAADTGPVSEVFTCTFKEGKTWEDFERINAAYGDILKEIGGAADDSNAFAWQPFRGNVPYTYLWAGYFASYQALANHWQAVTDSGRVEEIETLWGELETCNSVLTTIETIYDSPDYPPRRQDPDARGMIESFLCRLQPGKTLEDVRSAVAIWQKHANNLALPFDVYMRTPIVSGNSFTHSYFVTHGQASAYGANITAWRTHPDTAAIEAMLANVQTCTNALWTSWQVLSSE